MDKKELKIEIQRRTEALIRFRSADDNPAGLALCAKWLQKELHTHLPKKNIKIQLTTYRNIPSLVAVQGKWKHPRTLLNGHFDVVPGKSSQFTPIKKGDRLYGRGAADMKAGTASLLTAFIHAVHARPDLSIGLMLTGDEEVGGARGVEHLVKQGWKTDLLINLDGGNPEELSHAEKGILRLTFRSHGKSGRVHYPWEGKSALDDIIEVYTALEKLFPGRKIATAEDNWHSTFTPRSLITPPQKNSIIDFSELQVSIHFIEDCTPKQMMRMIRQHIPATVDMQAEYQIPRVWTDPASPTLLRFQKIYAKYLGRSPRIRGENGSSDARFFIGQNIPLIITKPVSGNAEQDDEWVSLSSTVRLTQAIEEFLLSL